MQAKHLLSAIGGALILAAGSTASAQMNGGAAPMSVAPGSLNDNLGALICTAAINADGTLAGGANVLSTANLGGGSYEVVFNNKCSTDLRAQKGYARWVQVDTLTTGSIGDIKCTTADRAGNKRGVWVNCTDGAGVAAPTSFFLFVAR
jgi:hypothetical protein